MVEVIEDLSMDCAENDEIIPNNPEVLAELKKENGNQLFKIKQYRSALPLYTEAIELCPNTAAYYGNRAACYMMLTNYRDALEDARRAVQIDQSFLKGFQRIVKCSLALGDLTTADQAIKRIKELDSANTTTNNEIRALETLKQYEGEATKATEKKDYRKVVFCMDRCLDQSPSCSRYKIQKAENLAFLGRYSEAQDIVNNLVQFEPGNADAIYVRGICLFYNDNMEHALAHFQQVLRLAPDHGKAVDAYKRAKALKTKKEDGNNAYKLCKFQDAINLYTEALNIDPLNKKTNAKLYCNRATVYSRLIKFQEAIADCNEALKLDETYLKALLRRAKCYMEVSEYDDAVRDYEKACKMDKSRENKKLLQDAKIALKRSKRKDYYKILGIERSATEDEIKKAYRKRALVHHPDRHANASDVERKEQEKKFKEIGEAYGILSDVRKKSRYDNGQDMEDFDGGMSADIDPTQVFQSFFGNAGHGGGGTEFNFSSGGFPGGFTFQFG